MRCFDIIWLPTIAWAMASWTLFLCFTPTLTRTPHHTYSHPYCNPCSFQMPRFHGQMSRDRAEEILSTFAAVNGLFLIRQSERCGTDFAVSFYIQGHVFHNRVVKQADGSFINSQGTTFESLRMMVAMYQNRHPDMQCVLTEYVPRDRVEEGGHEYANAAMIQDAFKGTTPGLSRWTEADIYAAVKRAEEDGEDDDVEGGDPDGGQGEGEGGEQPVGVDGLLAKPKGVIDFDPIYDDLRFGFGDVFSAAVLSGSTTVIIPEVGTCPYVSLLRLSNPQRHNVPANCPISLWCSHDFLALTSL
eukprot:m.91492 g.91492  ORF g.91492 m.91492 type:complete len:301 (+) comp12948_c0_seq7:1166-2068(+)